MTKIIKQTLVIGIVVMAASGCSNKPAEVVERPSVKGTPTWHDFPVQPLSGAEKKRLKQHIYFEFDGSTINIDSYNVIVAHAQYLAEHPDMKVLVEGHADERGSGEYNRKLGMERSKSVVRVLEQHGVQKSQIIIRSYSTDKPVGRGQSEREYALNRRASIFY